MSRLAPPQRRDYTYKVITAPAELPVSLTKFKDYIKKPNSTEDSILTMFLAAATIEAEKLTRRDFIERTYDTFRDFFPVSWQNEGYYSGGFIPSFAQSIIAADDNVGNEIRKSPLVSITQVEYTNISNVITIVDSTIYYNTVEEDYSEILTNPGKAWPQDLLVRLQSVKITFVCGLSPDQATFEADHPNLCRAIMSHAMSMWVNRGDCDSDACAVAMPASAKSTYLRCRIENL